MVRYRIVTPEQVSFHYEVAGLAARGLANVVDQIFLILFIILISMPMESLTPIIGTNVANAILILAIFVIQFGYFTYFEIKRQGQSPGKRLFGLRVISATGGRLSAADVLMRNTLRAIDFLPVAYGVGMIVAFFDPYRRRLGDIAADTIVVRDGRATLPAFSASIRARANSFQSDPVIRQRILARVNRDERDLVWDLMLGRDELDPTVRDELFAQAAEHFRNRYSLREDLDYLSDEQTVLNIALVLQNANFGR